MRRVLLPDEHRIPRGWVSTYGTYGWNAKHLGITMAVRPVGSSLVGNPFPIIIPCLRAVRSNNELGGFQGGPAMKRALLELERVELSPTGEVLAPRMFY